VTALTSPRLSVLLPVRNGMPWLPEAVASLQAQTFSDFEVVVLEDGSTDGTASWLAGVCEPRMRIVATGGVGIAAALNRGLAEARGELVARQDADDISLPGRFARQVEALDRRADVDVIATTALYIDAAGNAVDTEWTRTVRRQQDPALEPDAIAALLPLTCCLTHGSVMARTSVLRTAGGYRPSMVPAEDYDLWLRLLPAHRFLKLAEPLYRYRLHAAQTAVGPHTPQTRRALDAKFQHVRRLFPHLPARARLSIAGTGRGRAAFEGAAEASGLEVIEHDAPWDLLAVTDFSAIDEQRDRLDAAGAPFAVVGNLFVRQPGAIRAGA